MRSLSESEIFDDYARETSVAYLRDTLNLPPKPVFQDPNLVSPLTVGIEIEENWRQALPELGKKWADKKPMSLRYLLERPAFTREYRLADEALREVLHRTTPAIPASNDSYHEFSFHPARNLNYTAAEVDALFEADLLRDGEQYALHMTVAGFTQTHDAFTFLTAQELLGATTEKRIVGAISARQGSWSQKGTGGIKVRRPDELSGDDQTGHELRSLCVTSRDQLVQTLGNAARLASLYASTNDWNAVRGDATATLRHAELPFQPWQNPKQNPELWQRYATLIASGTSFEIQ